VIRGGDFYAGQLFLPSPTRDGNMPYIRGSRYGFRCARAPWPRRWFAYRGIKREGPEVSTGCDMQARRQTASSTARCRRPRPQGAWAGVAGSARGRRRRRRAIVPRSPRPRGPPRAH